MVNYVYTFNKKNTNTNSSSNPQTGDAITTYMLLLGLSIIGLAGAGLYIILLEDMIIWLLKLFSTYSLVDSTERLFKFFYVIDII